MMRLLIIIGVISAAAEIHTKVADNKNHGTTEWCNYVTRRRLCDVYVALCETACEGQTQRTMPVIKTAIKKSSDSNRRLFGSQSQNYCTRTCTGTASNVDTWTQWSHVGGCSVTCGGGEQKRERTCGGSGNCEGDASQVNSCNTQSCPATWTQWSNYGGCSVTCGEGEQKRERTCGGPGKCVGDETESRSCIKQSCSAEAPGPCEDQKGPGWCKGLLSYCYTDNVTIWCKKSCGYCNTHGKSANNVTSVVAAVNQSAAKFRNLVETWYNYTYDFNGATQNNIKNGGQDMFDIGNKLFYQIGSNPETHVTYNVNYRNRSHGVDLLAATSYPFNAMMWVGNHGGAEERFALKVLSGTGADDAGTSRTDTQKFEENNFTLTYYAYHVYGANNPSLCEIFYYIYNTGAWNSVAPQQFTKSPWSNGTDSLQHGVIASGSPQNILMGYMLLAKSTDADVGEGSVAGVMWKILSIVVNRFGNIDGCSWGPWTASDCDENRRIVRTRVKIEEPGGRQCGGQETDTKTCIENSKVAAILLESISMAKISSSPSVNKGNEVSSARKCTTIEHYGQGGVTISGHHCEDPTLEIFQDSTKEIIRARDILFMVDESSSVNKDRFPEEMQLVLTLISKFCEKGDIKIGRRKTQVGVMTFDKVPHVHFHFDRSFDRQTVYQKASEIKYKEATEGKTCLVDALKFAHEEMFTTKHGARSYAEPMIILITDGCANCDSAGIGQIAKDLKEASISIVTYVINDKEVCKDEMKVFDDGSRCFQFFRTNWNNLKGVVDELKILPCLNKWTAPEGSLCN